MNIRARFLIFFVMALACNGEKRRLQEQLAVLQQRQTTLSQRLTNRKTTMREAQHQFDTLNADLTAYDTDVHKFISNHRIAAECIRASRSTWGENNAFSNEVSTLTTVGAALCGVALLDHGFAQEVAHVTDKLGDADTRVKALKEQIAAAQRTVDADRSEVQKNEAAIDRIAAEIADVQVRLERD